MCHANGVDIITSSGILKLLQGRSDLCVGTVTADRIWKLFELKCSIIFLWKLFPLLFQAERRSTTMSQGVPWNLRGTVVHLRTVSILPGDSTGKIARSFCYLMSGDSEYWYHVQFCNPGVFIYCRQLQLWKITFCALVVCLERMVLIYYLILLACLIIKHKFDQIIVLNTIYSCNLSVS